MDNADDYGDEDEIQRVDDFEDENEQYRSNQRQQQARQMQQKRDSRPQVQSSQNNRENLESRGRMAEVQAAEDRLAALDLHLDGEDNNLLLDEEDPFADVERRRPQKQQRQR